MKAWIAMMALSACGGEEFTRQCSVPCLGPVVSDVTINCDNLEKNHATALAMIFPFVPNACAVYKDVPFKVQSSGWPEDVIGHYQLFGGITVDKSGKAHLHEMFHHWDTIHFALGTAWHEGWLDNGYMDAAWKFEDQAWPMVPVEFIE